MHIFLSWSGPRSRSFAAFLRDWIPQVVQSATTWMSDEDIGKGRRWSRQISDALEATHFGLVVITPENQAEPWLNFEAGALAKMPEGRLWTVLVDVEPANVTGPLADFQHSAVTETDFLKLTLAINDVQDRPVDPRVLRSTFSRFWGDVEAMLDNLPAAERPPEDSRSETDISAETLEIVRRLARDVSQLSAEVSGIRAGSLPPAAIVTGSGTASGTGSATGRGTPSRWAIRKARAEELHQKASDPNLSEEERSRALAELREMVGNDAFRIAFGLPTS